MFETIAAKLIMKRLTSGKRFLLSTILFCLLENMILSTPLEAGNTSYIFRQITTGEELTQAWVTAVQQDYMGFMWFGTVDGLYRYDGYEFKIYRSITGDDQTLAEITSIIFLKTVTKIFG